MATKFKLTEERLNQLKDELLYLQTVREKEVAELIKEARSFGDLSENSEYDEAKTEQGKLYSKIAELQNIIENAEIIDFSAIGDTIALGTKVTVTEIGEESTEVYEIVGSQEADPIHGKISEDSPFGKSLMGRKKDDEVEVDAPSGMIKFKIVDFSR
jgi:transcription elongation factor GreA